MRRIIGIVVAIVLASGLSGCGYNQIQAADEATRSAWSEVINQYQRRADLIPNLVNTVKGFADQEREVLIAVTEARSRVGQIRVDPADPASLSQFEQAQAGLGSALSRLLVVSENYPQLKSDANFRDLQAQLEGTENRIAVARAGAPVPGEPHCNGVRPCGQAAVHGGERGGDREAAGGELRSAGKRAEMKACLRHGNARPRHGNACPRRGDHASGETGRGG